MRPGLAHELIGGGHIAQIRAAAAQGQTKGCPSPGDVRARSPGRFRLGQGNGIAAHDVLGARLVDGLAQGLGVLKQAEKLGCWT